VICGGLFSGAAAKEARGKRPRWVDTEMAAAESRKWRKTGGKGGERDQESHEAKSRRVETGRRKSILYGAPSLHVKGDFIYICVLTRFDTSQQELLIVMNRVKVNWNETTGKRRKRGGARDDPKAQGDRARQRAIKPLCRGAIACRLLRALEFLDCEFCDV
jgi:hypothetical protein